MESQAEYSDRLRALEQEFAEVTRQQAATVEVLQVIGESALDLDRVFDTVLRNAVALCRADAGQMWRLDGNTYRLGCSLGGSDEYNELLSRLRLPPGKESLPGKVSLELRTVQLPDVLEDRDYSLPEVQRVGGFRTMLGVPMLHGGSAIGVIVVWRREVNVFDDTHINLAETFATQGAIAIATAELFGELAELNRTLEARVAEQVDDLERVGRLKRFLSPKVAELIVSERGESILDTHRSEITAVFCDIRGFTAFAETVEPEEVIDVLRRYYETVAALVSRFGATLDHVAGDGVLVYFNDPVAIAEPALTAVRMAVAMRDEIGESAVTWRKRGYDLDVGVGVALGHATLGTIGAEGLFQYASIGSVTNLAARLSDEAEGGQILISARVQVAVEEAVECEPVGPLSLKGFARPVKAFNVINLRSGA